MASLTHVCMWSNKDWKHVTAEQAARLHPGGTVSARSGLFMCDLCGQYVILTDGDIKTRYFKHSAYEKSKDCPERTFGANYPIVYDAHEHALPIRIVNADSSAFRFEIGLVRAPIDSLDQDFRIEIKPQGNSEISFVFAKERLKTDGITYLPIGEKPFEKYTLSFYHGNDQLYTFWPTEIQGIDPEGTLFDKDSGKKLARDADVEIGKEYYLLMSGSINARAYNGVQIQKITQKRFGWNTWTLYLVSAPVFCENAARFYLDFHCRLTEYPVSMQPVWPLFVEDHYMLRHHQSKMYMLVTGHVEGVKTFPVMPVHRLNSGDSQPKLYEVVCAGRQQLISAGRTHALQYTYFWKEPLDRAGLPPKISVTDLAGTEVAPGETDTLPRSQTLRFHSAYDGELIVSYNNRILRRQRMPADQSVELDELAYGLNVQALVGLDVIWQIIFKKQPFMIEKDETALLKQITSASGPLVPAPHALRNILAGMQRYPRIGQWIRGCMKSNTIPEQAYRRLQALYRGMKTNR